MINSVKLVVDAVGPSSNDNYILRISTIPRHKDKERTHSQYPIRRVVEIRRLVAPIREGTDLLGRRVRPSRVHIVPRRIDRGDWYVLRVRAGLLGGVEACEPGGGDGACCGDLVRRGVEGFPL